jgi:hypothetical protein
MESYQSLDDVPTVKHAVNSDNGSQSNFVVSKRGVYTAIAVVISVLLGTTLFISQSSPYGGLRQASFESGKYK